MKNNKFPWNCGDCPMLKTYDMSIDDLTHICLWSKKQIDDCDRYKSSECPLDKHDAELLNKVKTEIKNWQGDIHDNIYDADEFDFVFERIFDIIAELKAEVEQC